MSNAVLVFDAAGLALFAVTGSSKALSFGLNPVMATVLGMVTGIGGGMVRDVLLAEIPTVLRADLYAVAALVAAAIVVIGHMLQLPVAAVTAALTSTGSARPRNSAARFAGVASTADSVCVQRSPSIAKPIPNSAASDADWTAFPTTNHESDSR